MADVIAGGEADVAGVEDHFDAGHGRQPLGRPVTRPVVDDDDAGWYVEGGERLQTSDRVGNAAVVEHDDADALRAWRHARRTYRPVD